MQSLGYGPQEYSITARMCVLSMDAKAPRFHVRKKTGSSRSLKARSTTLGRLDTRSTGEPHATQKRNSEQLRLGTARPVTQMTQQSVREVETGIREFAKLDFPDVSHLRLRDWLKVGVKPQGPACR